MTQKGREAIENKIDIGGSITEEMYADAIKGAIQARSTITYLVWKELQERHPEVDATAVLGAAYRKYGQLAGASWEKVVDAQSALLAQCSKGGYLVFEQELGAVDSEYAAKAFHACPHVEQWRKLGATDEEIKTLCQDILSEGDYGNLDPHEGISLEFSAQIGAGDDHCMYCLRSIGK